MACILDLLVNRTEGRYVNNSWIKKGSDSRFGLLVLYTCTPYGFSWFKQLLYYTNQKYISCVNSGLNFYLYLIWLEILVSKYVFLVTVKGIQNTIEIFTKAFLCRLWCLKIPYGFSWFKQLLYYTNQKYISCVVKM
jgi:hypothetical protein